MIAVSGSKLICSFCGTSEDKADLVFARDGSQICSQCVTKAHAAMRGARVGPFHGSVDGGIAPRRAVGNLSLVHARGQA